MELIQLKNQYYINIQNPIEINQQLTEERRLLLFKLFLEKTLHSSCTTDLSQFYNKIFHGFTENTAKEIILFLFPFVQVYYIISQTNSYILKKHSYLHNILQFYDVPEDLFMKDINKITNYNKKYIRKEFGLYKIANVYYFIKIE